jgi:hypothetical protein
MKRIFLSLALFMQIAIIGAQSTPVSLGELKPFWRNHPVLGPFLQDGIWLDEVPGCFFENDFAYKKRPFPREVLFADRLTVVRILGGTDSYPGLILSKNSGVNNDGTMKKSEMSASDTASINQLSKYDFVYRQKDGSLAFRKELIKNRLKPYTDNGYTDLTIVLDNVPWCLTKTPIVGSFGQVAPPDNPQEWYATIKELCITLKEILGDEKANKLRFRIGTEMNGRERFAGTEDQFITHYDYAAAAIADVLPNAPLGIYNTSSASVNNVKRTHNINTFHLFDHAANGINRQSGKPNKAIPYAAISRYYSEKNNLNQIVSGAKDYWDYIRDSIPGYKKISREIQEYGAIGDWSSKPRTDNPDAFGNAMNISMLINLYASGVSQIYLWNMLDKVNIPKQKAILIPNSQLWGYSVLEYMTGGKAYQIIPITNITNVDKTTHTALLSVFNNKAYLLVTAFNPDRTKHDVYKVSIKIPKNIIPFAIEKSSRTSLTNSNSISYNLRTAIENADILSPLLAEKPEYTTNFRNMTSNMQKATDLLWQNWEEYTSMWQNSLTLKTVKGIVTQDATSYTLNFEMTTPESTIIVLDIK